MFSIVKYRVATYINVSGPVDLTRVNLHGGVVLGGFLLVDMEVDAITRGHSEVRDEGNGRDESGQDMEKAFLLPKVSSGALGMLHPELMDSTYNRDSHGHSIEGERRQCHEDGDDPGHRVS